MPTPDETLAEIDRLLSARVDGDGEVSDMTLVQRVQDLINSYEGWSELAIRRLHEIHRLTGHECQFCSQYLDGQ
jgi:hypothetical protein